MPLIRTARGLAAAATREAAPSKSPSRAPALLYARPMAPAYLPSLPMPPNAALAAVEMSA
jgi:hypothetical protein